MSRSADYTIQGFLYQFNKTLLEVLEDNENSEIRVEGIIEDIEVSNPIQTKAIQCKYHEAKEKFVLSTVYKPVLQMMEHFHDNKPTNIEYKIFAYFQDQTSGSILKLTNENIKDILSSENSKLQKMIQKLKGNIDVDGFLKVFSIEFGSSLGELIDKVCDAFKRNGIDEDDIDTLTYPNALQIIADLSIEHEVTARTIKKSNLLERLKKVKKTAVTRWTRALQTFDKILKTRRKQLKSNLDKNSRLRYFLLSEKTLDEFDDCIVNFIMDYINKYHFKPTHNQTPIFCLDCSLDTFNEIRVRLVRKKVRYNDGLITDILFDKGEFYREPIVSSTKKGHNVEFSIRLLHVCDQRIEVLNDFKCDDLFIVSEQQYNVLDAQDVSVERIELRDVQQIKYVLGMSDSYE